MNFIETKLHGCFVLEPRIFEDGRGYFMESFNQKVFEEGIGQKVQFVQDNQSQSSFGVVRGLHYQTGKFAQAKLVRVLKGRVLDVAVDLRPGSPTYGEHISCELTEMNKKQMYVPRGFAHGFSVLSESAEFFYKCDNFYNKQAEAGVIYNDPSLNIDWGLDPLEVIVSIKDKELPNLQNAVL